MYIFPADHQVDAGDGQHDGKQDHSCGRGEGGVAAAVAIEHIVDVAHDGVHPCGVQIRAKQSHGIAVRFECTDEARDDQIEQRRGDHGQGDPGEDTHLGGAVDPGSIVVVLVNGCQRTGEDQHLEGHDHPDGIEAQHEHLCPVRTIDEVHGTCAEPREHQIDQTVGIGGALEQDHEHQSYCQGVGHIGKEVNSLEQVPQGFDGAERGRQQQGDQSGQGYGDDHQKNGVLQRLQKIGIPQHIGIVVCPNALKGLGGKVEALFCRVDHHIDQRIDKKHA